MRNRPPIELVELLGRLGLATLPQVEAMENRVRRLARDLPWFESVWIGALAQARLLTPYQTAEINAGRGERLRVGPYTLRQPSRPATYAECHQAVRTENSEPVRLMVFDKAGARTNEILLQLEALVLAGKQLDGSIPMIVDFGIDGSRIWAASPWLAGIGAADWMLNHGRFPPDAVLAIGRVLAFQLAELESAGICHGDIGIPSLWLRRDGSAVLLQPGLRGIVRPEESLSLADIAPEAYASLAPERVKRGTRPSISSDVYSFGCVMSHLLCGRSPLGGGDGTTRLRAVQAGAKPDIERLVRDVPDELASAIVACLDLDPQKRPASFAQLAESLGPANRAGLRIVARCLAKSADPKAPWIRPSRQVSRSKRMSHRSTAAVVGLMSVVAIAWPIWVSTTHSRPENPLLSAAGKSTKNEMVADPRSSHGEHPARQTHIDHAVAQAEFEASAGSNAQYTAIGPKQSAPAAELVLPADREVAGSTLMLKPGQWVHAEPGRRARIIVPAEGLVVAAEEVRFENVDFVATDSRAGAGMLRLQVSQAEFTKCSFDTADSNAGRAPAIAWTDPKNAGSPSPLLPAGRLRIKNCVFRHIGIAIDAKKSGAVAVELGNTLHLGTGPLVRLDHCPEADEPVRIVLSQVTVRDAAGLLDVYCTKMEDPTGEISFEAAGCVFAPAPGAALMTIESPDFPGALVRNIRWSGQGSLITPASPIASWQRADGVRETVDDTTISIAGLVRSSVEFAGPANADPSASRVLSWQAPLQSAETPGADVVFGTNRIIGTPHEDRRPSTTGTPGSAGH